MEEVGGGGNGGGGGRPTRSISAEDVGGCNRLRELMIDPAEADMMFGSRHTEEAGVAATRVILWGEKK